MSGRDESLHKRAERLGRNEAIFRAVNDRIKDLNDTFSAVAPTGFQIVCECGNLDCVTPFPIALSEYARVRTDPTLFLLVPGHEDLSVETVVEQNPAVYVVVRKHPGTPADIAAQKISG
jgi:hypothetical protein